jgi:hypothetical protein
MPISTKEVYDYLKSKSKNKNKNHINPYAHTVFDTGREGDEHVRGHYYDIAPSLAGRRRDENEFETYDCTNVRF